MPLENFRLIENDPVKTLQRWARQLNYIQRYIDPSNIEKAEAISVTISDTGNYYASTSVEMALNEIGSTLNNLPASTVAINDTGGYFAGINVETVLQEIGSTLDNLPASTILVNDTGGYYTSVNVESVLQEVGSTLRNFPASTVGINDTGGYYTSTSAEGALQEIGSRLYGYLEVSATTGVGDSTFNVSVPFQGKHMSIYCLSANSSDRAIAYSGGTDIFFGPATMLRINFTEAGQVVELIGISTSRWAVTSIGTTSMTATLPTLST